MTAHGYLVLQSQAPTLLVGSRIIDNVTEYSRQVATTALLAPKLSIDLCLTESQQTGAAS